jgi:hypothetical protein
MSIIFTVQKGWRKFTFVYPNHLAAQKETELLAQGYTIISKEWSKA